MRLDICFKKQKLYLVKIGAFAWYRVKLALFSVSGLKDEKLIKSKPTWKLKHVNSIPESFEYFCQTSSKSIIIIFRYTVSKCVFETQCIMYGSVSQKNPPLWFSDIFSQTLGNF